MKKIVFLRHGRASEKGPHIDDRSRMLIQRGVDETKEFAHMVHDKIKDIDIMISSAGWRAKMTAELVAQEIGYEREFILYDQRMRDLDFHGIINLIQEIDDKYSYVLLAGHNKMISEIVHYYAQYDVGLMAKSGMVGFEFSVDQRADVTKNTVVNQWHYFSTEDNSI